MRTVSMLRSKTLVDHTLFFLFFFCSYLFCLSQLDILFTIIIVAFYFNSFSKFLYFIFIFGCFIFLMFSVHINHFFERKKRTKYFDLPPLYSIQLWKRSVEQVFTFGLVSTLRKRMKNKKICSFWKKYTNAQTETAHNVTQIKNSLFVIWPFFAHFLPIFKFHLLLLFET